MDTEVYLFQIQHSFPPNREQGSVIVRKLWAREGKPEAQRGQSMMDASGEEAVLSA